LSRETKSDLTPTLRDSLAGIEAGETIEQALARFPEQAEALRPLLETALNIRQLQLGAAPESLAERIGSAIVAEARQASDAGRRAAAQRRGREAGSGHERWRLGTWPIGLTPRSLALNLVTLLVALGLLLAGATRASANSLPGDLLYPVKLGIERMQLILTREASEAELASHFAERRLAEADALEAAGQSPAPALAGLNALSPWSESLPAAAGTAIASPMGPEGLTRPEDFESKVRLAEGLPAVTLVPRRGPPAKLGIEPKVLEPAAVVEVARSALEPTDPSVATALPLSQPTAVTSPPLPALTEPAPAPTDRPRPQPTPTDGDPRPSPTSTLIPPPASPTRVPPAEPTRQPELPGGNLIEGSVSGADGPIEGARISIFSLRRREPIAAATTDADGVFRLRVAQGRYHVLATAAGYTDQWHRGKATAETADPLGLSGDGSTVQLGFRLTPERLPLESEQTPERPPREPRPGSTPTADRPRPTAGR